MLHVALLLPHILPGGTVDQSAAVLLLLGDCGPPQPPEDSRADNLSFLSAGLLSYYRLDYFQNIVIIDRPHLAGKITHSHAAVSFTDCPLIHH